MSGHTPGPWVVRGADTYRWQIEHGEVKTATVVARITTPRKGGAEASDANAHLIAAAPDMLEAAEALIHRVAIPHDCPERIALVAAIKKARGEK